MRMQPLPLNHKRGICEELLLIHTAHGTAQLPILQLGVVKVAAVGCRLAPDTLHCVYLLQPVVFWP